jgi:hypothetical protein
MADCAIRTHDIFLKKGGKDNPMRQFPNRHEEFDLSQYKDECGLLE